MPTYVALLRAINLGANRKFPTIDVQRVVEQVGGTDVAVHLNTGNVRLTSRQRSATAVAARLEQAFATDRGFEVPTVVLTPDELARVAADAADVSGEAPFAVAAHFVSFLREDPGPEAVADFTSREHDGEYAVVRGRAVHLMLDTADRYRTARLPVTVEKVLGVATNRNLTVVSELARRWT